MKYILELWRWNRENFPPLASIPHWSQVSLQLPSCPLASPDTIRLAILETPRREVRATGPSWGNQLRTGHHSDWSRTGTKMFSDTKGG